VLRKIFVAKAAREMIVKLTIGALPSMEDSSQMGKM